jgi:hypothetical protein
MVFGTLQHQVVLLDEWVPSPQQPYQKWQISVLKKKKELAVSVNYKLKHVA